MPPIKLEKVVSVSSEDPVHVAANLLKGDFSSKKWKSRAPGEKQISLVVQLDKPSKITGIDVGNENSAFVEILVAKSSAGNDEYKVLLAASSLMSLKEAKFSTNTNSVKFFKAADLCQDSRDDKWDRVKIVCTQPYNTVTQFGLSFIVFHTDTEADPSDSPDLGKFQLKPKDTDQQTIALSAWELMTKKKEQSTEHRGAAAVNAAVRTGDIRLPSAKNAPIAVKVTALSADDKEPDEVPSSSSSPDARKAKTPKQKKDVTKTPGRAPKRNLPPPKESPKKKAKVIAVSAFSARPRKPFNRLLEDVVFVISGFQNPFRSDIRNAALAMGGRYKADWDRTCTHLVCAFRNTPKFNQVQGSGGKIVKKEWIEQCYESRKRIPWRRFALDPQDQNQPESDEEIWEDTGPPPAQMDNRRRLNDSSSEEDDVEKEVKRIKKQATAKAAASPIQPVVAQNGVSGDESPSLSALAVAGPSGVTTQDDAGSDSTSKPTTVSTSVSTTVSTSSTADNNLSIYEVETEDEASDGGSGDVLDGLPRMPSYFDSTNFILLDDIDENDRAKLKRYIAARLGNVVSDLQELSSSNPIYCITEDETRLAEVKEAVPNVIGVTPDWIWLCHDENKLADATPYLL